MLKIIVYVAKDTVTYRKKILLGSFISWQWLWRSCMIFRVVTSYSLETVLRFGRIYHFQIQCRRVCKLRNQQNPAEIIRGLSELHRDTAHKTVLLKKLGVSYFFKCTVNKCKIKEETNI
jgi:hypothetical protein